MSDIFMKFWHKLSKATVVLNHGDITRDNILWNEGKILSLMDFEHSVIAPAEIDLNSFINLTFFLRMIPSIDKVQHVFERWICSVSALKPFARHKALLHGFALPQNKSISSKIFDLTL